MNIPVFIFYCLVPGLVGSLQDDTARCGYNKCHPTKEGFINVHLVPHSHDDVGWLKTVDQYYYGSQDSIQVAGVQYIIDTVTEALRKDSDRRFIQVETAFFSKWYTKQSADTQAVVKQIVTDGQLEFVGGAWSMNDEATTHYQSIIDQFSWGLKQLNDTFGKCGHPKAGWQIDPFGHSKEMASLFAQIGYDAFILARTDFQDRQLRESTKTNHMVWRGNVDLGESTDIFTHILYHDRYGSPDWFCFDSLCTDPPFIDDPESYDYNVDQKLELFFDEIAQRVDVSPTDHILIPIGADFTFQNAEKSFTNIDRLIYQANIKQSNGSRYNLLYSTPSCYARSISEDEVGKLGFPMKRDDFFPYGTGPEAYWTGYYTSRPTFKRLERIGNNFLQVCKQLSALSSFEYDDEIDELRSAMGILQHHDAITGTEKQHVANDYIRHLQKGIDRCQQVTTSSLNKLSGVANEGNFETCFLTNVSQCATTERLDDFVVTVYNPLSRPVTKYVRLPVTGTNYTVRNGKGDGLAVQLNPIPDEVLVTPGRDSNATLELIFVAEDIPALGFKKYYVSKSNGSNVVQAGRTNSIDYEHLEVALDESAGIVSWINFDGFNLSISQDYYKYPGRSYAANTDNSRSSGAYIFQPAGEIQKVSDKTAFKTYVGELVSEIHQTFSDYVSQVIRIYSLENFVEFEWLVGPLDQLSLQPGGYEVVSVFTTDLSTNSTFYTDSNGKQMSKRIKNFRPTFKWSIDDSVAPNYYPVTSKILIRDPEKEAQLTVLNDRPQGGSSVRDGELELMVHRLCVSDDGLGVAEALIETAFDKRLVVRGSHYVVAGKIGGAITELEKDITHRKHLDSWIFLSSTDDLSFENYIDQHLMEFSGLSKSLPSNVRILTLEPWREMVFLLRLEHIFDVSDASNFSQTVTVDLKDVFSTFDIYSLRETTIGANNWAEDNERLQFALNGTLEELVDESGLSDYEKHAKKLWEFDESVNMAFEAQLLQDDLDNLQVVLTPGQIRTFAIEINSKSGY
ncbi:lysosomal alpha-mannosidase-like [Cylas formicarius]|uniref:lysosomal alpha-mannosidase-like n=1 Tax=Cylas formicarius TaxID=197179 RepID=UPI002958901C|nr:lysosomal alpha-mannosidase-like [Cylas formicarius]